MFQDTEEGVIISLFVIAKASKSEIIGPYNNSLKVKIKAPPVDGEANEEIIRFFAKELGVPKRQLELIKGDRSKLKKLIVFNMKAAELMSKISTTL